MRKLLFSRLKLCFHTGKQMPPKYLTRRVVVIVVFFRFGFACKTPSEQRDKIVECFASAVVFGIGFEHRVGGGAAAGKAVEHQRVRVGGKSQNALNQSHGFWRVKGFWLW